MIPESQKENLSIARTFWCFISYRHADNVVPGRQWATWLHQTIEAYEVPADLVGRKNDRGDIIPENIFPVFRDEEELPADAELSRPIESALVNSKFLVVLCSPQAVESRFVADEILRFKQLGKADRILAAMIEGEPNASSDTSEDSRECFPEPLRHTLGEDLKLSPEAAEPIAADFRLPDGSQGWTSAAAYREDLLNQNTPEAEIKRHLVKFAERQNLMILKIIAGILGVPLGTLTERDKAYQLAKQKHRSRVLRRWLLAVSALALLAAISGIIAFKKTEEAQSALEGKQEEFERAESEKENAKAEEAKAIAAALEADRARTLATEKQLEAESANERTQEALEKTEEALVKEEAAKQAEALQRKATESALFQAQCKAAGKHIREMEFDPVRKILLGVKTDSRDSLWALLLSIVGPGPQQVSELPEELVLAGAAKGMSERAENYRLAYRKSLNDNKEGSLSDARFEPGAGIIFQYLPTKWSFVHLFRKDGDGVVRPLQTIDLGYIPGFHFHSVAKDESGVFVYVEGSQREPTKNILGDLYKELEVSFTGFLGGVLGTEAENMGILMTSIIPAEYKRSYRNWEEARIGATRHLSAINFSSDPATGLTTNDLGGIELWNLDKNERLARFGDATPSEQNFEDSNSSGYDSVFDPEDPSTAICFLDGKLVKLKLSDGTRMQTYESSLSNEYGIDQHIGEGTYYSKGNLECDGKFLIYHFSGKHENEHYLWKVADGKMLEGYGRFSSDENNRNISSPILFASFQKKSKLWVILTQKGVELRTPHWDSHAFAIAPVESRKSTAEYIDFLRIENSSEIELHTSPDGEYFSFFNYIFKYENPDPVVTLPSGCFVSNDWKEIYFPLGARNPNNSERPSFYPIRLPLPEVEYLETEDLSPVYQAGQKLSSVLDTKIAATCFKIPNRVHRWMSGEPIAEQPSFADKVFMHFLEKNSGVNED